MSDVFKRQRNAEMAELADAHGSGPCGRNTLRVRLPFSAVEERRQHRLTMLLFLYSEE